MGLLKVIKREKTPQMRPGDGEAFEVLGYSVSFVLLTIRYLSCDISLPCHLHYVGSVTVNLFPLWHFSRWRGGGVFTWVLGVFKRAENE